MQNKILILLIIILAALVRLINLSILPPSLNWDEVSLGYNAYSILKTGQDEWGQTLPLSFRAYGDYKLPAYIYLDVPFVSIFGLNEWGVRLPSALAGIGTVVFIFLILKQITKKWEMALWGAFITATAPWSIVLSRIALEANLSLFLTVAAFYFFLIGVDKNRYLFLSALFFGLTIFTYNSSRVVTPLLIFVFSVIFFKKLQSRWVFLSLLLFLVFFAVALPNALLQDSSARYKWTAILDEGAINKINELRGSSTLPSVLASLQYNKLTYATPEIIKNYISHFDPRFLFITGGSNYQYGVPGHGLVLVTLLPFLLLGLWKIFQEREKWKLLVLAWLLLSPIPAAITRDAPHSLRALMMIPPLVAIISLGMPAKKLLMLGLIVVVLGNFLLFWQNYSGDYTKNYSWSWQYGYKEVVDYIKQNGHKYEKVSITKKHGEPHEFLLFYLQYDPSRFRHDLNLVRYSRSDWYWVDNFDKYYFFNDWELNNQIQGLLITSEGNYPKGSHLLKSIDFLDGKRAFDIVEVGQVQ